jgi:ribosomal protein S18 acetylase RimI-like enzyme
MKKNASGIDYIETNEKDLNLIGDLWLKLREHHKERINEVFKQQFDKMTFNERKRQLLEKSGKGGMLVHLAKDNQSGKIIGYCVSTVSAKKQGEVDSIFIEAEYRNMGIGDVLMKKALQWMDEHSVTNKILGVGAGNEDVFSFYQKYNFYPRTTILEQVKEGK